MELVDVPRIDLKEDEWIYVHGIGDVHRASINCDAFRLRSDINVIKHRMAQGEKHYWIAMGDLSNAVGPKDPRYDSTAIASQFTDHQGKSLFQHETWCLAREFAPIKDACIGVLSGNHEEAAAKRYEFHPSIELARDLGVPYLGYCAGIRFMLRRQRSHTEALHLFAHHGFGAARTKGAKINMLWSLRDICDADVFMVGHVHEPVVFEDVSMGMTRRGPLRLTTRPLTFINTGTYVKTYTESKPQAFGEFDEEGNVASDYAEQKGYRPSVIGHGGFKARLVRQTKGWEIIVRKEDYRI